MFKKSEVAAVILAGGAGRRFAGQDKGLVDWRGKPLISHVLGAVTDQVGKVVLSVNRNLSEYQKFGCRVLRDDSQGFLGPMAGICTAIHSLEQETAFQALLVSSCDSPALPHDHVNTLLMQLNRAAVAVVHDGTRRQNLHCVISRAAWPSLCAFFDKGGRAMHQWIAGVTVVDVDFSHQAEKFSNINSPSQTEAHSRETL